MFILNDCLSSVKAAALLAEMKENLPWFAQHLKSVKSRRCCASMLLSLRNRSREFEHIAQLAREYAVDFGDEYGDKADALALAYEAANVAQAAKALAKQFDALVETLPYEARATRKNPAR